VNSVIRPGTSGTARNQAAQPDIGDVMSGFMYNPFLLFAPGYFAPLALNRLQPYMTGDYTHRWFSVPFDPLHPLVSTTLGIPAGLTVRQQLRISPGSVIAGWRLCTLGTGGGAAPAASNIMFQVTDGDTQLSFTQGNNRFLNANALIPTGASGLPFCLFPEPYEVNGGVISVALSNTNPTTNIMCQMLLYVLEPVPAAFGGKSGRA
jgi:hypothetical protein